MHLVFGAFQGYKNIKMNIKRECLLALVNLKLFEHAILRSFVTKERDIHLKTTPFFRFILEQTILFFSKLLICYVILD